MAESSANMVKIEKAGLVFDKMNKMLLTKAVVKAENISVPGLGIASNDDF